MNNTKIQYNRVSAPTYYSMAKNDFIVSFKPVTSLIIALNHVLNQLNAAI